MAVTITKSEGRTVITLSSDTQSVFPPLCQILKSLCFNPMCCSVSQHMRRIQRTSQTVLGTLQIMVGLFNIGIGVIFCFARMRSIDWFPFWLGPLFMLFGIISMLSEKYPSPCLVIVNVILNLAGVGFAITAITLYSISMADIWLWWMCEDDYGYHHSTSSSSGDEIMKEKCVAAKNLALMLLRSLNGMMIVLSVLELCVAISSVVLGIKALKTRDKEIEEPEQYKPLLVENPGYPEV
ncbi:hypothetical protein PBY51_017483 [Eleginops maclovinus]|uniref:Uncharacterized protein n=1 Tax=Eleginops maclovinus TaxID=56733 RepID=A0AAN7XD12_ELEMC|nr:hypothetical protein PBY51_017483 [Eleginops maclovinus]